tara:strand:- start:2416 stop:2850 length:435 start_codon:yes stop_codon:yes gene_type:complete
MFEFTFAPILTLGLAIFILPLMIFFFLFWLWMLIDCIKSELDTTDKLIWVLIIIFINFIGALIYLLFVKMNKNYKSFKKKHKKGTKRLYRSKSNRVLGGVCGGIGEYFGIDPTLIRLAWVLFTFVGGSGVLAYIICWIIIPEEK